MNNKGYLRQRKLRVNLGWKNLTWNQIWPVTFTLALLLLDSILTPQKGRNSKINSPCAGSLFLVGWWLCYQNFSPNSHNWACSQVIAGVACSQANQNIIVYSEHACVNPIWRLKMVPLLTRNQHITEPRPLEIF